MSAMKNWRDKQKLETIGRQAMNIQVMEAIMKPVDSDGNPIDGEEHLVAFIYNLEKITSNEVERLLNNGEYIFDSRILQTDPETFSNIFPHKGEAAKGNVVAYWRSREYANDFIHCECSKCGFMIDAIHAIKYGESSTDYVGVKYRFCPKCGSPMNHKPKEEVLYE